MKTISERPMKPIKSQSGRTTRTLLTALLIASKGGRVVVVGITQKDAISLYERALIMANKTHHSESRSTLKFCLGYGRVKFSAPMDIRRMTEYQNKGYHVLTDHLTVK